MNILIIGAKGQLGVDLMQASRQAGWEAAGFDLPECDITDPQSLRQSITGTAPYAAVINAAAYTAVDQAEAEPDAAFAVNSHGVANLAQLCAQMNTPLIHISTDYVFDGEQTRPYLPTDAISPVGVYGHSKASGEDALRSQIDQHVIVRTSWLYGIQGANFVKTMLHHGKQRDELRVVDDQIGSPTYSYDLAGAVMDIARQIIKTKSGWGTYHYCNEGALTWYAFARKIFAVARQYDEFAVQEIIPILSQHYPTPAPRPKFSVLDCSSTEAIFGLKRRRWDNALREMLTLYYAATRSVGH